MEILNLHYHPPAFWSQVGKAGGALAAEKQALQQAKREQEAAMVRVA
jgi:hypothetical protein